MNHITPVKVLKTVVLVNMKTTTTNYRFVVFKKEIEPIQAAQQKFSMKDHYPFIQDMCYVSDGIKYELTLKFITDLIAN